MIRTRLLAVAGMTVALALVAASPATALHVRPSKAPMHDASGHKNGCTAEIPSMFVSGDTPTTQSVIISSVANCPESADVHRQVFQIGVWEVLPKGELREVVAYDRYAISASPQGLAGEGVFNTFLSCSDPANAGTHTWLARARINAKQTLDNSDPNPYWAKVDRKQTITC